MTLCFNILTSIRGPLETLFLQNEAAARDLVSSKDRSLKGNTVKIAFLLLIYCTRLFVNKIERNQ